MRWIIQENLYNEDGFHSLLRALDVMGLPHSVHKIVPFSRELRPEPTVLPGERVIVCGAYTMTKIAKERGWLPGAYLNGNFEFAVQREHWGEWLLNGDAWFGRLDEVPEQRAPFFIRPTSDSKVFAGEVMDWHKFTEWQGRVLALGTEEYATLRGDTQVMVATHRTIYREYRTWVVGGKVVTASLYKEGTRVRYDALVPYDILDFAHLCADRWVPDVAYVFDVAETPDGLRIIEVNCLNSAGFYAGNVGLLVQALEDLDSAAGGG